MKTEQEIRNEEIMFEILDKEVIEYNQKVVNMEDMRPCNDYWQEEDMKILHYPLLGSIDVVLTAPITEEI